MPRNEKLIHWDKIAGSKGGKELYYAVYETSYTGKNGEEKTIKNCEVFFPYEYNDRNTGEKKKGKDTKIPLFRLADAVRGLFEIDQKFNGGHAFAQFVTQRPAVNTNLPFDDDEVPF